MRKITALVTSTARRNSKFKIQNSKLRQSKRFVDFVDAKRLPVGYGLFLLQSLAGRKPTPPTLRYLRRAVLAVYQAKISGFGWGKGEAVKNLFPLPQLI
ncbi:hypothetical protein NIES2107_47470 [Nostoc carneum NIES-2107]|nr:hypothetical protein NIES2107_47470 [Nostoc carneum NIES-2107]